MEKGQDLLDLHEFNEEELKAESERLMAMNILDGNNAKFERTEGGFVSLKTGDKEYKRVGVYLTFPLTEPDAFISIREADEKAAEIGLIKNITDLSEDQQEMIREQIRLRYFMPVIKKVIDVKEEYGNAYWTVVTSFGNCKFTTKVNTSAVVAISDKRYLVTDIDGNRYDLPNFFALSVKERKKLDMFI